eukprot:GEMP01016110.1.p1 GENE.GEMP01016110.1~~GEMP01016110.1.p1  ORF type:complete len:510 (+),score=115.68 GEMP01016110.1:175-1704(+)
MVPTPGDENPHACPLESDNAIKDYAVHAEKLIDNLKKSLENPDPGSLEFMEAEHMDEILKGVIFVGHINTDLDSVAGAISAAELFGGIAAISEENLNGEILFALEECGLPRPPLFDNIPGGSTPNESGNLLSVCLVDHNEEKQMVKALRENPEVRKQRVVGLIDHHALASSFASDGPLFMDVRPWGSMSTIVTHLYIRTGASLKPPIAKILLLAILSDTLNLVSVTTTNADRFAVSVLVGYLGLTSVEQLAKDMFHAKTRWIVNLGAYEMARGDQKDFECSGWKFGVSVLEVTSASAVLDKADELILELRLLKKEKGEQSKGPKGLRKGRALDFAFLFVVDITKQESHLLIPGGREKCLAVAAFPRATLSCAKDGMNAPGNTITANETCMILPGMVSRKKQFAPALFKGLSAETFECTKMPNSEFFKAGEQEENEDQVLTSTRVGKHWRIVQDGLGLHRECQSAMMTKLYLGRSFGSAGNHDHDPRDSNTFPDTPNNNLSRSGKSVRTI